MRRNCETCEKPLLRKPNGQYNKRFCCWTCREHGKRPRTKTCVHCGKDYTTLNLKYCSMACKVKATTLTRKCKTCGNGFQSRRQDRGAYGGLIHCQPCWLSRSKRVEPETNPPGGWMKEVNLELLAKYTWRKGTHRAARKFNLTHGQVSGWWYRHGKALVKERRLC